MRPILPSCLAALLTAPAVAAAEPPTVLADTAITGSLVAQVMGDLGEIDVLLPQGSSPHHYQMRPSEARALQSADLLVWFGPELTPWLQRAAENRTEGTGALDLLHIPGTELRRFEDAPHDEHDDHGDDHQETAAQDMSKGDHGHDHDHRGVDPHAWLNPDNAAPWLSAIAESLATIDPRNAATYRANAASAQQDYSDLDARLADRLSPFAEARFVVFHDAYGYFTGHFGLSPAIAVSLGDATSPSAARLRDIRQQVTEAGATCAFAEEGHDPKLVRVALDGLTITEGRPLDPSGIAQEQGPHLHRRTLEALADALSDCLEH